MNTTDEALVTILGTTDALFWPVRSFVGRLTSNCYHSRKQYAKLGIHWRSRGADDAARKASTKALEDLVGAKLITRSAPAKLKATFTRLTDLGEITARRLVGESGLSAALWSVAEVKRLAHPAGESVAEALLSDKWCEREFKLTAMMLLPALSRGWVTSSATVQGHVRYRLTPAGQRALQSFEDPCDEIEGFHETYTEDAVDLWESVFAEERGRLEIEARETREIGTVPDVLSSGIIGKSRSSDLVPASWRDHPDPRSRDMWAAVYLKLAAARLEDTAAAGTGDR